MGLPPRTATVDEEYGNNYTITLTLFTSIKQWWPLGFNGSSLHEQPDAELLEHYQATRSSYVLDIVIKRHADALYHFLVTISDKTLAEDISQQTWLKIVENPQRYQQGKAQFKTWLFSVARNTVIDELRSQQRWQWLPMEECNETDLPDWNADLEFENRKNLQALFDNTLTTLPFAQKEALMLQLDGFSLKDIANITAENEETIKSRLRFARKSLKQKLEVNHD